MCVCVCVSHREEVLVCRAVIREDMSMALVDKLIQDIQESLHWLGECEAHTHKHTHTHTHTHTHRQPPPTHTNTHTLTWFPCTAPHIAQASLNESA